MKQLLRLLLLFLSIVCPLVASPAFADKLVLMGGRTVKGTVLQTNATDVLVLTDYGTLTYSRALIKEISIDRVQAAQRSKTNNLPDSKSLILLLNKQPWASNLKQIPATVIDKGILRNVPYISFRCGGDYEVNIYGDLDHPSGIEVGVYRKLLTDDAAKSNCVAFVSTLFGQAAEKSILGKLDLHRDLQTFDGLTFEITPPTAEDAYMGWWISVYSEEKLNLARATDAELNQITIEKGATNQSQNPGSWTVGELAQSRPSQNFPATITLTDSTGQVFTNAQVVRVIDGASLIWRKGASGGSLKLASLPEELRSQFGYDPVKAAAADAAERQQRLAAAQNAQAAIAAQQAQIQPAQYTTGDDIYSGGSSSGGRVYVRGYTRSNGTYVEPYTRSSPHRH